MTSDADVVHESSCDQSVRDVARRMFATCVSNVGLSGLPRRWEDLSPMQRSNWCAVAKFAKGETDALERRIAELETKLGQR